MATGRTLTDGGNACVTGGYAEVLTPSYATYGASDSTVPGQGDKRMWYGDAFNAGAQRADRRALPRRRPTVGNR